MLFENGVEMIGAVVSDHGCNFGCAVVAGNQQVLEAMRAISDSTSAVKSGSTDMLTGGWKVVKEMKKLTEITDKINSSMAEIQNYSSSISDAITITTASTNNTKESLEKLMKEISAFKL